jgi:putative oxidoreductase
MSAITLQHVETFTRSRASFAPTLLRWGLGAVFLAHVYGKLSIFTIPGTVAFFETHGFPGWTVYPVIALELLGGIGLLLGFQTRLVALALLPVMAGALVPHLGNGWMFTNAGGGWEYVAFLLVALSAQVLLGGGALSITREELATREAAR